MIQLLHDQFSSQQQHLWRDVIDNAEESVCYKIHIVTEDPGIISGSASVLYHFSVAC